MNRGGSSARTTQGPPVRRFRRRVLVTRVLPLREAFLIHMNDFDRLVEFGLRRMLDPVVASTVPPRRRGARSQNAAPLLVAAPARMEPVAETIAVVDPIVLVLPAQIAGFIR